MLKRLLPLLALCLLYSPIAAAQKISYPSWAVLGYYGRMTQNTLGTVIGFGYSLADEKLYSLEAAYKLSPNNPVSRFLAPIVPQTELTANMTYRDDPNGPIYEFNPYIAFRWIHFPWNRVITTSLALGWGVSYDTRVPTIETDPGKGRDVDQNPSRKLLNYLMFEASVALPQYPQLQVVYRIHHRSGVFGLYKAGNSGSTAVGLGVRYWF